MPGPAVPPKPPLTSAAPITASMDKALADTMAKLPPSGGFVRGTVATSGGQLGARLEVGHRFAPGWAAAGWAGLARGQQLEAGVTLESSWGR